MQSQNEKLSAFISAINEYAERQRLSILAETDEYTASQLERAEKEALNDASRMISRETADVRSSILRQMAGVELEGRKQLFEKRNAIEEKVFAQAKARLAKFTETDAYLDYLLRTVKGAMDAFADAPQSTTFRLRSQDARYRDAIREAFGADCGFADDDTIHLGGLLAVNTALGRAIDATLDSRLEQQRETFRLEAELPIS